MKAELLLDQGFPFVFEIVEVAAIVEPVDGNDAIWGIDDPGEMVYVAQETWDAWTSTLPIDPNSGESGYAAGRPIRETGFSE